MNAHRRHRLITVFVAGWLCVTLPTVGQCDDFDEFLKLEKEFFALTSAARYSEAEPIVNKMLAIAERSFQKKPEIIATAINRNEMAGRWHFARWMWCARH